MKKNKAVLVLSCIFSLIFLTYIFKLTRDFGRLEEALVESPNVIDVTDQIKTKIVVTSKQFASSDWSEENFDDSAWKSISIPSHSTVKEPEFKEGNFLYYRIKMPGKAYGELSNLKDELYFALQFVQLSKFDIYINGKFFRTSTPKGPTEFLTIVPINESKDNIIGIKGFIKEGDSGIYHRSKLLVGKGGELSGLHSEAYKSITVTSLIYILCKGSILFLLTLIFLVLKVERFFEKSLLYVMCVLLEDLMTGDYVTQLLNMNQQVYIYNLANIGINTFLFMFLADVLEEKYSRNKVLISLGVMSFVSYLIAFDILHTNYLFGFDHYLKFWNYVFIGVLIFFTPRILRKERVLSVIVVLALAMTLWSSVFSANVGFNLKAFANLLIFFGVAYQTFILFRREQIQLLEQEKDVAIGRTAAHLAHDVRRPLDQMNLILNRVSAGEMSPEFLKVAKQDVEFAITSVNNQINDIMNFNRSRDIILMPVSLYTILSASLKQVLTIKKNIALEIKYDFNASRKILGDESRLANVLTNLISNAVEAIQDLGRKTSGVIKFTTFVDKNTFVLKVFNDGPHIPKEILPDIFKPLFTHGKNKGTGLGLASVAKIIQVHGGEVFVENVLSGGVEFKIVLKLSDLSDDIDMNNFKSKSNEYNYETPVISKNEVVNFFRIFLLDDDRYVYEYFQDLIRKVPYEVELVHAIDIESANSAIISKRFDLYILDYDLGGSKTGQGFYHEKLNFLKNEVVLHSNRERSTINALNLALYPKPMPLDTLMSVINKCNESRSIILLVEDSKLISLAWKMYHGKHNLKTVSNPQDALLFLEGNSNIDTCVLDYFYDGCEMNGVQLAEIILIKKPEMNIFISTSASIDSRRFKVIKKNDYELRRNKI